MKQLLIVRHAEASWNYNVDDYDRFLNENGIEEATEMGAQLSHINFFPDLIISSGAKRALMTAKIVSGALKYKEENIRINSNIYRSSCDNMIDIIKEVPNNSDKLMITGHNPTFHNLSQLLSDEKIYKFSTCSMFCIEFDINEWRSLKKGRKKFMIYPSMYK